MDHILREIHRQWAEVLVDHMLVRVMDKLVVIQDLIKMQLLTVDLVVEEEQQDQHPVMVVEAVQALCSSHTPHK